jgi:hypothetical protein
MKTGRGIMVCLLLCCWCSPSAEALLVTLSPQELEDAMKQGREKGDRVVEYINRRYSFGGKDRYAENGIIRTKWSKVMVLAGLMAARDRTPSKEELNAILAGTDLQIDLHTFGSRMDFADSYTTCLVQSGKRIDPEKIAANDVVYLAGEGRAASGFPRYRATIRSYFPSDKINPAARAEIILTKDGKKVSFEVNFADYR